MKKIVGFILGVPYILTTTRARRGKRVCKCGKSPTARGLCTTCWARAKKAGTLDNYPKIIHPKAGKRNWSPKNIAWFAGLYEGEGSAVRHGPFWRIKINMTDEDVLEKVFDTLGVGTISGPYVYQKGRKPHWIWYLTARDHVYAVAAAIYPLLGKRRREKIHQVLQEYSKK